MELEVEADVEAAVRFFQGRVSETDLSLLKHVNLKPWCARNEKKGNGVCLCCDLTQFTAAPNVTEKHIRVQYLSVVASGKHAAGNAFLRGCMMYHSGSNRFGYQVPLIVDGDTCRVFTLCCPQFKRLFKLTESRLDRLRKKKKSGDGNEKFKFGYFKNGDGWHYNYNGRVFHIFRDWRAIEYKKTMEM